MMRQCDKERHLARMLTKMIEKAMAANEHEDRAKDLDAEANDIQALFGGMAVSQARCSF